MKKYTCSIYGCGRISKRHTEVLLNNLSKKYQIISVCDKNLKKAQKLGKKISVPFLIIIKI